MLLTSVTQHVKTQNWFAVFIDFLIVVFGVFIGIQVANWNGERIERSLEREYLEQLHVDFIESIKGQSRDLNFLSRQLSDYNTMLNSLDACNLDAEDEQAFQRGVNTIGYINPPRIFRRTVDEMNAAGRTNIIRNQSLKDQLSETIALVEWRGNSFTDSVARSNEHHRHIVEKQVRYDLSRKYSDPFMGEFVGVDFDIQTLCTLPQIVRSISAVSYSTLERQRAYQPILEQYESILHSIEQELNSRWGVKLK
ncbi:hypothetical protein [Marinicella litoralis]|uniref:Uncharacterized protein n=1 Tax=Marinicella litoralis TaxID=644220 RepID=A0A4R6XW45_9GAMM|nr:hypothetical protein [Marinicella litoralis]TDR22347.1 hypothetical protein C8D91_0835 [Marinicella litoralis]